jgi:phosphate binding protein
VSGMPRRLASLALGSALLLSACGGGQLQGAGHVLVDGSSTVAPLTGAAGEIFSESRDGVNVAVATSGTGGGFAKFCNGETDISNASREIKDEEIEICERNGIEFTEIEIANDALTIVVNKENTWATCLTVEEVRRIWAPEAEGKINSWSQVRRGFPDVPIDLYGAGTDSGTFDYFTKVIGGEEGASRIDYQPTEDDNVTVTGVAGSRGGLGYFGFSYYEESKSLVQAVAINNGEGCVLPTTTTAQNGTYAPLSRPLFIYVSNRAYVDKPQVKEFVDFYIANDDEITREALFVPLSDEQKQAAREAVARIRT